jgi:hypothetical protein
MKTTQCSSTDDWIKKEFWDICAIKSYLALKKNETQPLGIIDRL